MQEENKEYISKLRTRLIEMIGSEIKELYQDEYGDNWFLINKVIDRVLLEHISDIDTDLSTMDYMGYDYYMYIEYLQSNQDMLSWLFNRETNNELYRKALNSLKGTMLSIRRTQARVANRVQKTALFS